MRLHGTERRAARHGQRLEPDEATWTAFAVWLVGLVLAFGLRTWAHLRATGSTSYRGTTGRSGSPAWWRGVLTPAALLLGTLGPLVALTSTLPPPAVLVHPAGVVVGLPLE